jgi:predicted peptidase
VDLVRATLAKYPAIDPSRVHLTGLSMGSYGSWAILPRHHALFAGAVLVCGAGDETAAVATLGDFPIWAVHSADDAVVPYDAPGSDYRIFTALDAADARARAARSGSRHIFTTFPAGTTPVFSHGSWIPIYPNDVIIDWLFQQRAER